MPLIRNTIFLISKSYSVVHKMLSLIGNEVWGLNRDTQLKATDSLNIHVNSAMLVANGWRQIAFWVPNPHIALLSISNNVIFFPQCRSRISCKWFDTTWRPQSGQNCCFNFWFGRKRSSRYTDFFLNYSFRNLSREFRDVGGGGTSVATKFSKKDKSGQATILVDSILDLIGKTVQYSRSRALWDLSPDIKAKNKVFPGDWIRFAVPDGLNKNKMKMI